MAQASSILFRVTMEKKTNNGPSFAVLEQTILTEAALSRLTDRAEQEQQQNDEDDDDAASPQRITVDTSKPFLHQLHAVLALPETDDDAPVQREVNV